MRKLFTWLILVMLLFIYGCENGNNGDIVISGTVEVRDIRISSEVPGKVMELAVSEGDTVKSGQFLAQIDDLQYKIKLNAAEIKKAQLEVLLKDSARDFKKAKNLLKTNSIAKEIYDKAELQLTINKLRIKEIEENIKLLKLYIEKSRIFSPASGKIYEKYIETGEVISPGIPLFLLYDLKSLYIKTYIPEKYLGHISIKMEVDLKIDSFPEKIFKGKITFISNKPEFTPSTLQTEEQRISQVYEVRIELLEKTDHFKPGMFTTVIFPKLNNETNSN
ncbi:efflux RND transporter periplasmic adaptor subunit [Candidatus Dependentiae bacterium]|nr:efflux RND transporter periplasmic adaptor subunit [Candidatus Dependentiae bacterium]